MSKDGQYDDGEFEVSDVGKPGGPAASAERVASFMIGEGPARKASGAPDPVLLDKRVLMKGKPRARLFNMSVADDAQAYADLEFKFQTTGEISITKIRELSGGVEYALFITWIEYPKPEPVIREEQDAILREKKAALLRKVHEDREKELGQAVAKVKDSESRCVGITARKKQCSSKRKPGKEFCGRHMPPEPASVQMDSPPPTHLPLGGSA